MIVVVAEKPKVARDIAQVLGAKQGKAGFLEGNGYRVTWAIGHLVGLAAPEEMNAEWRRWHRSHLPMIPRSFRLVVRKGVKDQFGVVERLLNAPDTEEIIAATDAGREGELIFRYIYELAGCDKPVRRLWTSSLTPEAIRHGFRHLKDGADYRGLADAATARPSRPFAKSWSPRWRFKSATTTRSHRSCGAS